MLRVYSGDRVHPTNDIFNAKIQIDVVAVDEKDFDQEAETDDR